MICGGEEGNLDISFRIELVHVYLVLFKKIFYYKVLLVAIECCLSARVRLPIPTSYLLHIQWHLENQIETQAANRNAKSSVRFAICDSICDLRFDFI